MIQTCSSSFPVIVIGAGMAGLACAQTLQQAGRDVQVLEARNRLGGRIHSLAYDGLTFDLGASWIHGIEQNPLWALAGHYGLSTCVFNYTPSRYHHQDGRPFCAKEQQEFEAYIDKTGQLMRQSSQCLAQQALLEILETLDYTGTILGKEYLKDLLAGFFKRLANDPFATELAQLSAQYEHYEGYFEGDEVIFPQGYQQLISYIASGLNIQTGVEAIRVILKPDHVEIIDQNNQVHNASQVVIAVPLGVIKQQSIEFIPALPASHMRSIAQIGFGSFNKVFLEFEAPLPFRETGGTDSISDFYIFNDQWFNLLDLYTVYQRPLYLLLFGGQQSQWIDQASDDDVWTLIYSSLNANFLNIPLKPRQMIVTRWGKDPYSQGSFSYPATGHSEQLAVTLSQPIANQLFFTGEHCSTRYAGTVHGAYLHGCEVGQRLIRTLNP